MNAWAHKGVGRGTQQKAQSEVGKEKAHPTSSNTEMSYHCAVGLCAFQARQEEQEVRRRGDEWRKSGTGDSQSLFRDWVSGGEQGEGPAPQLLSQQVHMERSMWRHTSARGCNLLPQWLCILGTRCGWAIPCLEATWGYHRTYSQQQIIRFAPAL